MGSAERSAPPALGAWAPAKRFERSAQRHILAPAHRGALARLAGSLWPVADGLRLVQPMGPRRNLGSDASSPPDPSGPRGPHRLGPLVHRWHDDSGNPGWPYGAPGSGWCGEKGGAQEPSDHALGRSRGGFSTKLHLVTDGRGLPLAIEATPGQARRTAAQAHE